MRFALGVLLLATVLTGCVDWSPPLRPNSGPLGGRPRALAVHGRHAFLVAGPQLVVVDVADPKRPQTVRSLSIGYSGVAGARPEDVALDGDHAYVVDADLGLSIIDVSQPDQYKSRWLGGIGLPTPVSPAGGDPSDPGTPLENALPAGPMRVHGRAVAVRDGRAYVVGEVAAAAPPIAAGESTAQVTAAAGETWVNAPAATATALAAAAGGQVDRSGATSQLFVFDVAQPGVRMLQLIGQTSFPGRAVDLVLAGDHAFVAASQGGLRVIDIADPAQPRPIAYAPSPASAVGVAIADGHAFVAEDDPAGSGLQVIDISNPAAPAEVAGLRLARHNAMVPVAVRGVAVGDGRAWLATSDGLRAVDVSNPAAPLEVPATVDPGDAQPSGSTLTTGESVALALAGDRLYALDLARGMEILASDAERSWRAVGQWPALTRVTDVRVLEEPDQPSRLLVASAGRPVLLAADDVADGGPVTIHPIELPGRLDAFTLDGGRLYATVIVPPEGPDATVETVALAVVDLNGSDGPVPGALLPLTDYTFDPLSIAVLRDTAWVKLRDGAWLAVDVADPAAPQVLGRIARSGRGETLTAADGHLLALSNDPESGTGRLELLDVTDPLHPTPLGQVAVAAEPVALAVEDGRAYVAAREALQVVDLALPSAPQVVGTFQLEHAPRAISVRDWSGRRQVLLALGQAGFRAVDVSDPRAPRATGIWSPLEAPVLGVAAQGDRIYLANSDQGLTVLGPSGVAPGGGD